MKEKPLTACIRAEPDTAMKLGLAIFGRDAANPVHWLALQCVACQKLEMPTKLVARLEKALSKQLMMMVRRRDSPGLRSLADCLHDYRENSRDFTRAKILTLKLKLERERLDPLNKTLPGLALAIGFHGDLNHLRRLAKECQFPLDKRSVGRPRKNSDREALIKGFQSLGY